MAVYDYVTGTLDSARRQADRVVSPHDRQAAYDRVLAFAQEQPFLFSFAAAQVLLSLVPVLLFASFALGTAALALSAAAAFSLFWIGVASVALGCALLVTSALAALGWLWCAGAYLAATFVLGLARGGGGGGAAGLQQHAAGSRVEEKWALINKEGPAAGGDDDDDDGGVVKHEDGVDRGEAPRLNGEEEGEAAPGLR